MDLNNILRWTKNFMFWLSFLFFFIGISLYFSGKRTIMIHKMYMMQLLCMLIYYPLDSYFRKRCSRGEDEDELKG